MPEPIETAYLRAAFVAGFLTAAASVATAMVLLFIAGLSADSLGDLLSAGSRTWLVSIGSGLTDGDTHITIVPIGAWLVALLVAIGAVRWTLPDPVDDLVAFVACTGGVVALSTGVLALIDDAEIGVVRATVAGFVIGALGAALGAVSRHGGGAALWFTVSEDLRRAVRSSVIGVVIVLSAATILVLLMLLLHRERAAELWALLDPGSRGGVGLAAACLLAVPTAVLWTVAVLLGPGFSLGTQTSVDLTGAHLGAVPGFPVLAALPSPGEFSGWVFLLGLIPLTAAAVAGWRADLGGRTGATARLTAGASAGAVGGFVLGLIVGVSGGSVGPGRMAEAGPPSLTPLLVGVLVMALGGALGGALAHYREARAESRSDSEPSASGGSGVGQRHDSASPDRSGD